MTRPVALALILAAACSRNDAPADPPTKWLELSPMPVGLRVAATATAAQTQESLDRTAPPGMIVSARECILVVTPGSRGDAATQEAAIAVEHSGVAIGRREPPGADGSGLFLGYTYPGQRGDKLTSFRYEKTIGETTYRCEPFTGRPDVGCEEAACRTLRATARAAP